MCENSVKKLTLSDDRGNIVVIRENEALGSFEGIFAGIVSNIEELRNGIDIDIRDYYAAFESCLLGKNTYEIDGGIVVMLPGPRLVPASAEEVAQFNVARGFVSFQQLPDNEIPV